MDLPQDAMCVTVSCAQVLFLFWCVGASGGALKAVEHTH